MSGLRLPESLTPLLANVKQLVAMKAGRQVLVPLLKQTCCLLPVDSYLSFRNYGAEGQTYLVTRTDRECFSDSASEVACSAGRTATGEKFAASELEFIDTSCGAEGTKHEPADGKTPVLAFPGTSRQSSATNLTLWKSSLCKSFRASWSFTTTSSSAELGLDPEMCHGVKLVLAEATHLRYEMIVLDVHELFSPAHHIIFMEHIPNGELFDVLASPEPSVAGKPLSEGTSRRILQDVISGMAECYRYGVTHRDLKPEPRPNTKSVFLLHCSEYMCLISRHTHVHAPPCT